MIKGFLMKDLLEICSHLILICGIFYMLLNIPHHLNHLDISIAMLWSLQGRKSCRNNRIRIGTCRCNDTGCKGRIVTAAVLHVEYKCHIKHLRLQIRIFFIRTEHSQNILCRRKIVIRTMNIKTLISFIMIICMITVYRKHREYTDQHQAL